MAPGHVTLDLLCRTSWEFCPGDHDAVLGVMRFVPGGRIFGYDHPNERSWVFAENVLSLFDDRNQCTSRFDRIEWTGSRLTMYSHPRHGHDGQSFRLRQRHLLAGYNQHLEALHAKERLVDLRRPLIVLFNSGGNPYMGRAVVWEYLLTTADASVDYLRLAERSEPSSWYLKTAEKVKARIRAAALGRRKIILAGASSGGYAAIRFGEWLAEEGFVEQVVSLSVNPQTVHSLAHRQFFWAHNWDHFLPPTIDDETLDFLRIKDIDLDGLIGRNRKIPARHVVFYDSGNPAEEYYALRIGGCPSVELNPVSLGLPHALGIQEMERQGIMHRAVQTELN